MEFKNKHEQQDQSQTYNNTPLTSIEKWGLLVIVIGMLPWAYYCVNTFLPAAGEALNVHRISLGGIILLIIAPPMILFQLVRFISYLASPPAPKKRRYQSTRRSNNKL